MPYIDLALANSVTHGLFSRETYLPELKKLIADCLIPFSGLIPNLTLEDYRQLLDIGSGGGLPALPLAIANRETSITMVERNQTKAAFLKMALSKLDLNGEVRSIDLSSRLSSDFSSRSRLDPSSEGFDLATMRWVKATDSMLKEIFNYLSTGASLVYYSAVPENLKDSPRWKCQTFSYRFSDDTLNSRTVTKITLR
ncbi:MAG: class I SAM-dependent methyltransferase [candidate division Zixibacteria bacterium]|nr:class I SAM-dependent methyltransferase [candidate division Zixibacteria bacterium]